MTVSNQITQVQAEEQTEVLELTIVLPCLNEAETLEICVRKARQSLERLGVRGEVVVADNADDDETIVVTVYEPDPALWRPGFRRRRRP